MPGPVKTRGRRPALDPLRRGRPDRCTSIRRTAAASGAIAKGVRRARSRFGGRLEPFFRLRLVLHEGRGDLLTVTARRDGRRATRGCARDARALDAAARACDAVARLFETGEPHPEVFHLLCNELALLDADPARGDAREPARVPAQAPARRRARAAARRPAPRAASAITSSGFSGAAGGVVCSACEASAFALDEEAHEFLVGALGAPLAEAPDARRARAAPGRAGDRRDGRAPRARALRPASLDRIAPAVSTAAGHEVGLRLLRGLARHARPAGRQGRERRRDDARPRRRPRARRLHDHDRGVRRLHARGRQSPTGSTSRSPRRWRASRSRPASGSAIPTTRCSSRCAAARASRCRACSTRCSTSGSTTSPSRAWPRATGNERFAWDSYRRFVQMFGNVVRGRPGRALSRTRSSA